MMRCTARYPGTAGRILGLPPSTVQFCQHSSRGLLRRLFLLFWLWRSLMRSRLLALLQLLLLLGVLLRQLLRLLLVLLF